MPSDALQRFGDAPDRSSLRLLYVDGDGSRRRTVTTRLDAAEESFALTPVASAEALFDRLDVADCVVSWQDLPDSTGLDLLSTVRDRRCDLPVVVLAADGSERLASEAIARDVTDYVPVDGADPDCERLARRIRDAVAGTDRCVRADQLDGIEAAVEHAADPMVLTDTDGTIEYVNPAFEDVTGFTREEAVGKNPRILKSGVQDQSYYEEMWNAILDGQTWEEEIVNETKSGERYVAHQTVAPVTDSEGTVRKFVGIQRDVTRRQRLEEQLERSARTLEQLYDVAVREAGNPRSTIEAVLDIGTTCLDYPVGYFTHIDGDTQHVVAAVGDNDQIHEGATDPLGRTYCRKTIESDEPVLVSDAPEEGWDEDPAYEHFGLRCYVGARVVVDDEVYGTLCFGGEEPTERLVLEAQQSTIKTLARWLGYELERHRYERRLERQNDRLEDFASVVSHDLRNPLNVAQARLEIGRETGEEEHFDMVADSHERMETIIEDTLTLAREGSFVDETTEISLRSLAVSCWETVDTADATLDVADDCTLDADPDRLRHIFENLYRNAVEHGSTSRADADASADAVEHAGTDVTVEVGPMDGGFYVADDGPGIPADEREQVFDHGYSGGDGTGFGLAIVETVADAHGWTTTVTDSTDGGARFEFLTGSRDTVETGIPGL